MKLALLMLMMSACLIDFVSARGVAVIGSAGNFQARITRMNLYIEGNIHVTHNLIVFSSLHCQELFQDIPQYDHDPDSWYWMNRYF